MHENGKMKHIKFYLKMIFTLKHPLHMLHYNMMTATKMDEKTKMTYFRMFLSKCQIPKCHKVIISAGSSNLEKLLKPIGKSVKKNIIHFNNST